MWKKDENKVASMTIFSDGDIQFDWSAKGDFMGLAQFVGLLAAGQLNQGIMSAIINRGLSQEIPGDNLRASSVLEQFKTTLNQLNNVQLQEIVNALGAETSQENEPAVSPEVAFGGVDEIEEEEEEE